MVFLRRLCCLGLVGGIIISASHFVRACEKNLSHITCHRQDNNAGVLNALVADRAACEVDAGDDVTRLSKSSPIAADSQCTIYLAPSTIPGAGLGIFTTVPKKPGETIGNGDVFLPLYDLALNQMPLWNQHQNQQYGGEVFFNPFHDYVWAGEGMGMGEDGATPDDVEAMCPGVDAAINCHLGLINVGKALPVWDDAGLHRSRDPGAGALTPYHNGTTPIVNRDIPAGGELFKHYGDGWFESRPDNFDGMPLSADYPRAQALLYHFGRLAGVDNNVPTEDPESPSSSFRIDVGLQRELWSLIINFPFPSRTLNALPRTLEDAWQAIQADLVSIIQPHAVRDIDFLKEYGKCFDHIRPGRSRFTQAGRGAFAMRPLSKGTIISGSPVLHLPDYGLFTIYDYYVNETTGQRQRTETIIGQQVTLNYCFGHHESTLLLCPYGAGVSYINHNQTLTNVRVQWSRNGLTGHNDTWLSVSPSEMEWKYGPHLALDYVALRDIEEGEELFLDYGDDFEVAWQLHVKNWKPENNSETYASAHDFNARMENTFLRTDTEQKVDSYPENLQIRCHSRLVYEEWNDSAPRADKKFDWILDDKGYPCRIVRRFYEMDVDYYDVQVYVQQEADPKFTELTRSHVPRRAISFCDNPHSTDVHLPNAFRFPMIIPDDMFPAAWRNAGVRPETERIAVEGMSIK